MNYLKIAIGVLVALSASRFIPHPPNFTSLLALSFYIPAIFGIKFIPILILALSFTDLVLGFHFRPSTLFLLYSLDLLDLNRSLVNSKERKLLH